MVFISFALRIFGIMAFATGAQASDVFQLEFRISNKGVPSITFPEGFPRPPHGLPPHYSQLAVKVQSRVEILGPSRVRFRFENPISVITEEGDKRSNLTFTSMDAALEPEDAADLVSLMSLKPEELFIVVDAGNGENPTVEEVVQRASELGSLEPLAGDRYNLPSLLKFDGAVSFGSVSIGDLQSRVPVVLGSLRMTTYEVLKLDLPNLRIIVDTSTTSIMMNKLARRPRQSIYDPITETFLNIQRSVRNIRFRQRGLPEFAVFEDKKKKIALYKPTPDENVIHQDFRGRCSSVVGN